MKKLILVLMLAVLLIGCAEQKAAETEVSENVISEEKTVESANVKAFDLRIFDNSIDPTDITVKQGDMVELSITNQITVQESEDEQAEEKEIFRISEHSIDEQIAKGATTIITFTADKEGRFLYGDLSDENAAKGVLIVE